RMSASCPFSLTSRNDARNPPPALFTSTSTRCDSAPTASCTNGSTWARSRTSSTPVTTGRPSASMARATRAKPSALRSHNASDAPKRANASAIASPMPCAAPVTTVLRGLDLPADEATALLVETEARYLGYVARERAQADRARRLDEMRLPDWLDVSGAPGLRREAREQIAKYCPRSVGEAARLNGVTPADVAALLVALERARRANNVLLTTPLPTPTIPPAR